MLKTVGLGKYILSLVAIGAAFFSSQAVEAGSTDLNKAVQQCGKISSEKQRLTCFDQLVMPVVDSSVEPVVEVVALKSITAAVVDSDSIQIEKKRKEIDDFAKDRIEKTSKQKAEEVNSIELTISQLKKLIRGGWKITFENGQKWQQKDSTRINLKVSDNVVIEKGAFGVFYLKKEGTNKRVRVKRLK